MSASKEFDDWAESGKDKGMEDRHWNTAKHVLARMPVEDGDTVLDLGAGSGYACRALRMAGASKAYGLDGSPKMAKNARSYTEDPNIEYVVGDFGYLPFEEDSIDHIFTMEAFYYAQNPHETLEEIKRILKPGGTFYCAVNYYEENKYSHEWQEFISIDMTLWSADDYREAFEDAGLYVVEQDNVPDLDTEIPEVDEFPHDDFETRGEMVERFRELGTLLTVGVKP